MGRFLAILALSALAWGTAATAQTPPTVSAPASSGAFLLAPPEEGAGPVVVRSRFRFSDITAIDDRAETFSFTGLLTFTWKDPRQAFDAGAAGVAEKIYQGDYQFDEISPGWFPQVVLVNGTAPYDTGAVVLRIRPDGTSTLIQTIAATAKMDFEVRLFPFDKHRLEAIFAVPGFGHDEVAMKAESDDVNSVIAHTIQVPQWRILGAGIEASPSEARRRGIAPAFVASIDVARRPFHITRLAIFPLMAIVVLSFSVFWMDRSSVGDRVNVSFIGILTGVAYQAMINDIIPQVSYVTLIHGFLYLSFMTMCATVVVNLVVGKLDDKRHPETGDRIDRRCRWMFPTGYFGLSAFMTGLAFVIF